MTSHLYQASRLSTGQLFFISPVRLRGVDKGFTFPRINFCVPSRVSYNNDKDSDDDDDNDDIRGKWKVTVSAQT